jgi:hypothetical protein
MRTTIPFIRRRACGNARIATIFLALISAERGAAADETTTSRKLEIVLVGSQVAGDLLAAAIAPLLSPTAVVGWTRMEDTTLVAHSSADGPRIWIDTRSSGVVRIVAFASDAAPRVRIVEAPELTPVVAETVAQIARETASALLERPDQSSPTPPAAADNTTPAAATAATGSAAVPTIASAGGIVTSKQPKDLLFSASFLVRDEYGVTNVEAAYGGALSVAWPFRRPSDGSSVRPFLALSLELLQQTEFALNAEQIAQTMGLSWQPWPFLDLSLAIGGGIEHSKNLGGTLLEESILFGRAALGTALRLPAGFEQIVTVTLDVSQVATAIDAPPPNRIKPGILIGLGWRPRS